jgi:hypothetical protein
VGAVPFRERCRRLRYETIPQVVHGPLANDWFEKLKRSERFTKRYIRRLRRRIIRVAETIVFLSAWGIGGNADLQRQLAAAPPETRADVAAHLCAFRGRAFRRLGEEIRRRERNPEQGSLFLV